MRSESFAHRIGRATGRLVNPVRGVFHRESADLIGVVTRFRYDLDSLVHDRWRRLTGWMVLSQASAALVLVFRIATWLMPIPLGASCYLFWRYYKPWRA